VAAKSNPGEHADETVTSVPTQSRKRPIYWLKLAVTAVLIAIIVWQVDLEEFLAAVHRMNWGYMLAAWMLLFTGLMVSALKWQRLLMIHGEWFGYTRLFRWYMVGTFLSSFLPSTIGGDGYRIVKTMSTTRSKASAVVAVFADRVSGLLVLVMLGYAAAISVYLRDQHTLGYTFAMLGTIGLVCGVLALAAAFYGKLGRWLLGKEFVPAAMKSFVDHAGQYKSQPGQITVALLLSLLFHFIRFGGIWLILQGFEASIRIDEIALVSTLTAMIAAIPITVNGLGLQEGSMFYLLQQFGVPPAVAIALALIIRVNSTSYALIGGVMYFFEAGGGDARSPRHTTS
jgi:uncharacterized protein (TIRG00374 family)